MSALRLPGCVFEFNPAQLRSINGDVICIRAQSLAVLEYLAHHPNRTVLKEELWQAVWPNVIVTDGSLVQCIREIRRLLNDHDRSIVRTEHKRGYRLIVDGVPPAFDEDRADFSQEIEYTRSADGTLLAYASTGSGTPIVRAQHWMTHLELDWQDGVSGSRIRGLSEQLNLVRFDARGTGLSQRNVDPGGLDDWVDDLAAVIDAAGLEKCALFGPSGGAAISVRYAVRYPERVSCLILFGSNARGELHRGGNRKSVEAMCQVIEDGWGQRNGIVQQLVTNLLWPGADAAMQSTFSRLQLAACNGKTAARLLMAAQELTVEDDLRKIAAPTLVFHSINDAAVPLAEGELIARLIPNARLVALDSINHIPLPDEPTFSEYIAEIVQFVESNGK